jgi:hypothetical protein
MKSRDGGLRMVGDGENGGRNSEYVIQQHHTATTELGVRVKVGVGGLPVQQHPPALTACTHYTP